MKRFLIYLLLAFVSASQAQTLVEIPDSNFRNVLKLYYPNIFEGDKLNSILAETISFISVDDKVIKSLEGIQYFKNITSLSCSGNQLTVLPELPSRLTGLYCGRNQLTTLPELPRSLTSLYCEINNLTALPELPSSLTLLYCYDNTLTTLPQLPDNLIELNCYYNYITGFTASQGIPILPNSLVNLTCYGNKLTALPDLPSSLVNLSCGGNQLYTLPELPNSLTSLDCESNDLYNLPELPSSLTSLNCAWNDLTALPALPNGLIELDANSNFNLSCLPLLSGILTNLNITNTQITCLPNRPNGLFSNLPICTPTNNKSFCEAYSTISGLVFNDNNKNGIKDAGEFPRKKAKVYVHPSGQYTFTNNDGYYEIAVDSLKTYTISVEVPKYFMSISQTATLTFMGEHNTKDFALKAKKDIKDLSAILTPLASFARPGFSLPFVFEVENRGTTTENGTAYVDFPTDYILDSTSINSVNGNFNFTNLHPGEVIKMMVYGRLATTATLGDTLKLKGIVNIYDYGTDSVYSNNISEVKMLIRGSFDPNDKQGPKTVTPKQVQNGEFIEYTIRFQNTGTDTAFTVVIADTLTSNLLPETLEMMSTSHNCKSTVNGNQVYFEFLNILLPDSNMNEVKSHGYVRFKVKPKNSLKLGQSILNTASIYFDYNKPVVTNTVNTKVDEPLLTGIQTVSISSKGLAYPNPVENGRLFVSNARGLKYKMNNAQGQLMMNGTVDETGLDVSQLNPGMYVLEIGMNENMKAEKIVIR